MLKIKSKSIRYGALVLAAASIITGCSKEKVPDTITSIQAIPGPVTVYGKLIDASTRDGIGGVKVYMKVSGTWLSTTTSTGDTVIPAQSKAGAGAAETNKGDYVFSGLPLTSLTSGYPMVFQPTVASGYLQINGNTGVLGSYQQIGNISEDLGIKTLEKGVTATVRVVSGTTGNYVTRATSTGTALSIPIYWGFGGGSGSVEDVLATQDTTDLNKYTIVIPQSSATTLTVPPLDTNGDGLYDYTGGTATIPASCATGTGSCSGVTTGDAILATNIVINPIENSTALGIVATNLQIKGNDSGGGTSIGVLGKSDPIKLFFNMPLAAPTTATEAITLTYTDNFSVLTTAAVVTEVTTTVTAANSLLTITPSAALVENETYTLNYSVTSDDTIALGTTDSVSNFGATNFTVYATGTGTIGSTPTVTVDNINHWTNGAVITTADTIVEANGSPNLVFPELVWGTVRHISTTSGTTTTLVNGAPVAITGQAITYYNTVVSTNAFNTSGLNRAGALFLFDLNAAFGTIGTVADNKTATPQSYLLGIDAYDSEGNTYRTESSFSVQ